MQTLEFHSNTSESKSTLTGQVTIEASDALLGEMKFACLMKTNGSPLCAHFAVFSGDLYTQAAEAAMEAMKGRLANQYYEKAEEAWAQMEE